MKSVSVVLSSENFLLFAFTFAAVLTWHFIYDQAEDGDRTRSAVLMMINAILVAIVVTWSVGVVLQ